ncbi:MAG: ACP S-malonyltransferase [Dehalococcoidia bacterium]|nr:ACP S-malonyltransferase [Dehalococcoidia bacterium]
MIELDSGGDAKAAYVFPGQGSQVVGMGRSLYQTSPAAQATFQEADSVLGMPLSRLCFEGPEDELKETCNAQPAILTASIACLRAASELGFLIAPSYVAGHSLGEYTALVAARVVDFSDAVILVRERGRLMHEAGLRKPGGMAAVMGLDDQTLEEVCMETGAQIANFNCSGQIVISGTREALARSMDLARTRGARRVVPLQVSGAFHSSLMEPAVGGMAEAISRVTLKPPEVPIVANSTAQSLTSPEEVREELLRQLCHCVKWQPSIEYMVGRGVSTFVEIGPGQVLSGLIKRITGEARILSMNDLDSIRAITS